VNCKESFRKHSSKHPFANGNNPKLCPEFKTNMSCICKYEYSEHKTMFETRDERIKRGKTVGNNQYGFSIGQIANEVETN